MNNNLKGTNTLLMGPSGTGKTYALKTLVDWAAKHDKQVFVLFTESGLETLIGAWTDHGLEVPKNLHWHMIDSKPLSIDTLMNTADNVGKLSYESITKMTDPNRSKNNTYHAILSACSNFVDQRTGEAFGAIDSWDTSRIFVIDGLSQLSNAAMKMVIGSKPTASMPDYGVAQNNLINFIRLLTDGCRCHVVLIAHVNREKDEITGGVKLMVKTIGVALCSEIPTLFSDVIYTVREADKWYWDTANSMADVKTRNLPIGSKLPPDFATIYDKWESRAKATGA